MFLSECREFPSAPCLAEKKRLDDSSRLDVVEIAHAPLTCFRACFLPGRAKGLSAPRYWPEDGLENTETRNHTRMLVIVVFRRNKKFGFGNDFGPFSFTD